MNTTDLMVNYRSLTHSFHLAQEMGITRSRESAEMKFKERSTSDQAYYNYALRRTKLSFETEAGIGDYYVSLRDCYIQAMRDNLVTLTDKADPLPGESRTGQVCTIQGTDLGIPTKLPLTSQIPRKAWM